MYSVDKIWIKDLMFSIFRLASYFKQTFID